MFKLFLTIALAIFSIGAHAAQADQALALRYLEASKFEEILNTSIAEQQTGWIADAVSAKEREQLGRLFESVMGWNANKDRLAALVIQMYTREEIEAYLAYLGTPAGASMAAKSAEFTRLWTSVVNENFKKVLGEK